MRRTAGRRRRPTPAEPTGRKRLSKLTLAAAAKVATALVGGLISFYLPRLLAPGPRDAILINVEDDPESISSFAAGTQTAALPSSVSTAKPINPALPFCADFHRWVRSLDGVDVGSTRFRVTVQGNSEKAIVITQVRAQIMQRAASTGAVFVHCPTAGDASIRSLEMDLDTARPIADEAGAGRGTFGVTLGRGETEILDITAATDVKGQIVTWVLEISATVNGKSETLRVQNRGQPFRTHGPLATGTAILEWGDHWAPRGPFSAPAR